MKHALLLPLCLLANIALSQTTLTHNGKLTQSTHHIFDADNHLSVTITYHYDTNGVVMQRQLSSYNKHGNLTHTELYTADEILLYSEHNSYDKHGNLTRRERHYFENNINDKSIETRRYKHNSDNTITITYFLNNKEYYKVTKPIDQ